MLNKSVRRWVLAPVAIASLLAAAACSSSSAKATSPTTLAAGTGGLTSTTASNGCKFDTPLKIVALAEKPPESANAIADFDQGYQLAVDDVGPTVCGQKLEFQRLPVSVVDPNAAKNAYLQALDQKPSIVVGIPSSGSVLGVAAEVAKAQMPMLYQSVAPQAFVGATNGVGSEWGFILRPRNSSIAALQADYLINTLGKKNIGLLCVTNSFGSAGCDGAQKAVEALGAKVVDRETNDTTSQDLTTKVIALKAKNVDGVLAFTFPNNLTVFLNEAADNGLNVPIFGGSSTGISAVAAKPAARTNAWGTDDCIPVSDPAQAAWVARYEKKYGTKMTGSGYNIAESYDAVMIAVQAAQTANSTDPTKIASAIRTGTFKGVCENYKADAGQGMHHTTYVDQFDASGLAQSKKKVDIPAA